MCSTVFSEIHPCQRVETFNGLSVRRSERTPAPDQVPRATDLCLTFSSSSYSFSFAHFSLFSLQVKLMAGMVKPTHSACKVLISDPVMPWHGVHIHKVTCEGEVRMGVNRGDGSIIAYFKLFLQRVKYECVDGLHCGVWVLLEYALAASLYNSEVTECVCVCVSGKVNVMTKISAAFLYKYRWAENR